MRLWGFRVFYRHRRHEYQEFTFATHREAYRFAMDIIEDPAVYRVVVTDAAGRRDDFIIDERLAA